MKCGSWTNEKNTDCTNYLHQGFDESGAPDCDARTPLRSILTYGSSGAIKNFRCKSHSTLPSAGRKPNSRSPIPGSGEWDKFLNRVALAKPDCVGQGSVMMLKIFESNQCLLIKRLRQTVNPTPSNDYSSASLLSLNIPIRVTMKHDCRYCSTSRFPQFGQIRCVG